MGYVASKDFAEAWLDEKAFEILGLGEEQIGETLKDLPDEIERATVFLST